MRLSYSVYSTSNGTQALLAIDYLDGMKKMPAVQSGDDILIGSDYVLVKCLPGFKSAKIVAIDESTEIVHEWTVTRV